jgi:hypothetical protein
MLARIGKKREPRYSTIPKAREAVKTLKAQPRRTLRRRESGM